MFFRKRKRNVPGLNTSSTADISFMLLILFLVTTSIDSNKGISRRLPAIEKKSQQQQSTAVNARHLMQIDIKKGGVILLNGKATSIPALKNSVIQLVNSNGKQHLVQLKADRDASYDTYFKVQNEVVSAYQAVKNQESLATYGRIYDLCNPAQQTVIDEKIPERLSEVYVSESDNKEVGEGD